MESLEKYELMYLKLLLYFSIICFVLVTGYSVLQGTYFYLSHVSIILIGLNLFNLAKYYIIKKRLLSAHRKIFMLLRATEILIVLICMYFFMDMMDGVGILLIIPIIVTALLMGTTASIKLVCFSFVVHYALYLLTVRYNGDIVNSIFTDLLFYVYFYSIPALFAIICGMVHKDNQKNYKVIAELHEELKIKYKQLEDTQAKVSAHYNKLKETNTELELTNEKLGRSVAQLYTIQKMSQVISTVFNIKELLDMANDAIIGVLGVDYSTIALVDKMTGKLKVHTTNIKDEQELIVLKDNLNSRFLKDILNKRMTYMDIYADRNNYSFIKSRAIKSLAIIPITSKTRNMGLVIIEKTVEDSFVKESVSFMDMISQQIGIALENAELYRDMKELATRDYLTGVYNRLYFRNHLKEEIKRAKQNNYSVSLAIFDIDYFKKFNDTYGHMFGDKVIFEIATLIKNHLRKNDIIARYGGEEFVIVFSRTNLKQAYERIEELRRIISKKEIMEENISVSITASFGVASFPECAKTDVDLLKCADNALYVAKSTGRNCVVVANPLKS